MEAICAEIEKCTEYSQLKLLQKKAQGIIDASTDDKEREAQKKQLESAVEKFNVRMNTFERDLIIAMVAMCILAVLLLAVFLKRRQ